MPETAENKLIRDAARRISAEVEAIKPGKRYESNQSVNDYVDALWGDIGAINSMTAFEFVDHFRIASYVAEMNRQNVEAHELLLLLHQLLKAKMKKSKHRDFIS